MTNNTNIYCFLCRKQVRTPMIGNYNYCDIDDIKHNHKLCNIHRMRIYRKKNKEKTYTEHEIMAIFLLMQMK